MSPELEFLPGDGDGGDDEDVLEVGRDDPRWWSDATAAWRRLPRRGRAAVGVALVAGVVAAAVTLAPRSHPTLIASPPTTADRIDVPAPPPGEKASVLSSVRALAGRTGQPAELVRQTSPAGACASVRVGRSPALAIAHATRAALPAFRVTMTSRVLDQFTGLCAIDLRSPSVHGAVLVISVSSPAAGQHLAPSTFDQVSTGYETSTQGTATKYVLTVTRDGWRVLIGATGRTAALPRVADLLELGQDRALLW